MSEKCSERRIKLNQALRLVEQLIELNETAYRTNLQMTAAGISDAEVENTLDAMLAGGGPPKKGGAVALDACTADKITDRVINLLNVAVAGGVDWEAEAE